MNVPLEKVLHSSLKRMEEQLLKSSDMPQNTSLLLNKMMYCRYITLKLLYLYRYSRNSILAPEIQSYLYHKQALQDADGVLKEISQLFFLKKHNDTFIIPEIPEYCKKIDKANRKSNIKEINLKGEKIPRYNFQSPPHQTGSKIRSLNAVIQRQKNENLLLSNKISYLQNKNNMLKNRIEHIGKFRFEDYFTPVFSHILQTGIKNKFLPPKHHKYDDDDKEYWINCLIELTNNSFISKSAELNGPDITSVYNWIEQADHPKIKSLTDENKILENFEWYKEKFNVNAKFFSLSIDAVKIDEDLMITSRKKIKGVMDEGYKYIDFNNI